MTEAEQPGRVAVPRITGLPDRHLELKEEQLVARKKSVQSGELAVTKEVVTETREIEVPITDEVVVVDVMSVETREPSSGFRFGEGELTVTVSRERVALERRPCVYGELDVQKQIIEEPVQVSAPVRKEVPRVAARGQVRVRKHDGGRQLDDF